MKKKGLIFLIASVLILATALTAFVACKNKKPDEEKLLLREYWSLDYATALYGEAHLKKIRFNENGDIDTIYDFNTTHPQREVFHYKDGKLEHSETFSVLSTTSPTECFPINDVKLYETRYVYEGDKIVRGEVLSNGFPTRSYDVYTYTADGSLNTVERYDSGKLSYTYTYNGKEQPESISYGGYSIVPTYDENRNVVSMKATGSSKTVEVSVQYSGTLPSRTVRTASDRSLESELNFAFHQNGRISEIKLIRSQSGEIDPDIYKYDESGRLLSFESNDRNVEIDYLEGKLREVRYISNHTGSSLYFKVEYDQDGFAKSKSYFSNNDNLYSWFEYDKNGNVTKHFQNYDGQEFGSIYEYSANGVLKKQIETSIHHDDTIVTTYSAIGYQILSKTSDNAYTEYLPSSVCYEFSRLDYSNYLFFNVKGTLITKRVSPDGMVYQAEYRENFTMEKDTIHNPDGSRSVSDYDENGRIVKTTTYDADGNVVSENNYSNN